jgi:hypothetical protein
MVSPASFVTRMRDPGAAAAASFAIRGQAALVLRSMIDLSAAIVSPLFKTSKSYRYIQAPRFVKEARGAARDATSSSPRAQAASQERGNRPPPAPRLMP